MSALPHSLAYIRQVLAAYFADKPVRRVQVFGSYARGEATAASDLDLLLSYEPDDQLSLLDLVHYRADLEQLLGLRVDMGTTIDPYIRRYVTKDLTLAYEQAAA